MKECAFCGTPADSDQVRICALCGSAFPEIPVTDSAEAPAPAPIAAPPAGEPAVDVLGRVACRQCGQRNLASRLVCGNCGASLAASPQDRPETPVDASSVPEVEMPEDSTVGSREPQARTPDVPPTYSPRESPPPTPSDSSSAATPLAAATVIPLVASGPEPADIRCSSCGVLRKSSATTCPACGAGGDDGPGGPEEATQSFSVAGPGRSDLASIADAPTIVPGLGGPWPGRADKPATSTDTPVRCPSCGAVNHASSSVCRRCNARLGGNEPPPPANVFGAETILPGMPRAGTPPSPRPGPCPGCGTLPVLGASHCHSCGRALTAAASPAPTPSAPAPVAQPSRPPSATRDPFTPASPRPDPSPTPAAGSNASHQSPAGRDTGSRGLVVGVGIGTALGLAIAAAVLVALGVGPF